MTRRLSLTVAAGFMLMLSGCASLGQPSAEIQSLITRAESGDVEAQFLLGSAYDTGSGVRRNGKQAEKWYRLAAEKGYAEAQNSLGSVYQAEERFSEATHWYQKAAIQGHALAINNLAYLYDLGLGVPQSREKAHELYTQSANLGGAEAMFNLASMYGAGQLGEVDYYKAYIWCSRSSKYAEPGRIEVQKLSALCLEESSSRLTIEDIARAKEEAENWLPTTTK